MTKPFRIEELRARLEHAMHEVDLQQENRLLREQLHHGQPGFGRLIGLSPKVQKVYKTISRRGLAFEPAVFFQRSRAAARLRHELNNPLTGILGNAELLLSEVRRKNDGRLPQGGQTRLETIAALAVRLRETVRRLSQEWEAGQAQSSAGK